MFPKNLLQHSIKCFKSIFSGETRYLKVLEAAPSYNSRCCSTTPRGKKGSSSFKKGSSSFDTAAATMDNDTRPENPSSKRKGIKAGKKKVKIRNCDPIVSKPSLEIGPEGDQGGNDGKKEEARGSFVVEKLKEMKMMMMDERNSEHLMDIEEIIYYYSLITSHSFMEIVDKFFADLYSEFSGSRGFPGSSGGDRLVKV